MKQNVNLALFFPDRGCSFFLVSKHLRIIEKVGMLAVKHSPFSFQYVGKQLKNDNDIFKLTVQQNEKIPKYSSERLRKKNIQS